MPLYLVFYFWLVLISGVVFALERLFPRRPDQSPVREGLLQDIVWLVFNTQYISWMLALAAVHVAAWCDAAFLHVGLPGPSGLRLIAQWPLSVQFTLSFVLRDFLEWNIHRWLHTVPWLWRFHKLHHSVQELDWAASFRSHWFEIVIYQVLVYLPLVVLGVSDNVVFATLVVSLLIQELSHANLAWDWGPLRYVINSPRFHAWHHDVEMHGHGGQNFGITFVIWDWLFGTAYWPGRDATPARLGFVGDADYPTGWWARLWEPFRRSPRVTPAPADNGRGHKKSRPENSGGQGGRLNLLLLFAEEVSDRADAEQAEAEEDAGGAEIWNGCDPGRENFNDQVGHGEYRRVTVRPLESNGGAKQLSAAEVSAKSFIGLM